MMRSTTRFFLPLAFALAACSSDGTEGAAASKGAAPKISNLSFKSTTLAVGKIETIQGTVDFEDADGDFVGLEGQASISGQTQAIPRTGVTSTDKTGKIVIQLQLGASVAGTANVEFWGVDKNGNQSNRETATFEVK